MYGIFYLIDVFLIDLSKYFLIYILAQVDVNVGNCIKSFIPWRVLVLMQETCVDSSFCDNEHLLTI